METSEQPTAAPPPSAAPLISKAPKRHTYNPKAVQPPRSAKGPMKLVSAIFSSGIAVLIILFAMGKLPQVDAFWDNLNHGLQSHNDEILHLLYRLAPTLIFAAGAVGLFMLVRPSLRRKSKSA